MSLALEFGTDVHVPSGRVDWAARYIKKSSCHRSTCDGFGFGPVEAKRHKQSRELSRDSPRHDKLSPQMRWQQRVVFVENCTQVEGLALRREIEDGGRL